MIIGVCGFGSTGSSAVSDFLSEFDGVQVIDRIEFTFVTEVDGLIDLEFHLFHPHGRTTDSIYALKRYKRRCKHMKKFFCVGGKINPKIYDKSIENFLSSITQIKWPWFIKQNNHPIERARSFVNSTIIRRIESKRKIYWKRFPQRYVSFSVAPKSFYEYSKKHVEELLIGMGWDKTKDLVLDQPFSGSNPQSAFPFFNDARAIVVDRDPRDLYCFGKTKLAGRNHFMPVDTVENFVSYYRALRKEQPYLNDNPQILRIRFEDLVYNYESTSKKIVSFLNYDFKSRNRIVFDPEKSIANTQVYKRFPEFSSDVEYIEKELKEYLFDFSKYDLPTNTEMFFGKSSLNTNK